jgi:hypothetical protein
VRHETFVYRPTAGSRILKIEETFMHKHLILKASFVVAGMLVLPVAHAASLPGGAPWETLRSDLVESLEAALSTQLRRRSA